VLRTVYAIKNFAAGEQYVIFARTVVGNASYSDAAGMLQLIIIISSFIIEVVIRNFYIHIIDIFYSVLYVTPAECTTDYCMTTANCSRDQQHLVSH